MNRRIRTYGLVCALAVAALVIASCQHNVNLTSKTAAQKVAVYNAALAKSNLAVVTGAIELQKAGTVPAAQVRVLLQYCDLVANTSEAIRIAMVQPSDWPATVVQIQKVMANVNTAKWLASAKVDNQQLLALLGAVSSTMTLIVQEAK